jgi:hypothetical protein
MWGALSDERMDLSFTTAAGPRQRSHSGVRDESPGYGGGIRTRLHTG